MKKKVRLLTLVFCSIGLLFILSQCRHIALYSFIWAYNYVGDGYNKAEPYAITSKDNTSISSDSLLNLFYEFQMSHPDYQFMVNNEDGELSHKFHGKGGKYDYDFVFFYFKDIDIVAVCYLEMLRDSTLLINLNGVCSSGSFRKENLRLINNFRKKSDERISRRENRQIKKKFETEILDASGVKWKRFKRPKYNLKKLNELYGDSCGNTYGNISFSRSDFKCLFNRNENNDSYDFENYPIGNNSSGSVKATLTAGDFGYDALPLAFPDTNILDPVWCFPYGIEINGDYPDEDCPIILHSFSFTTIDGDTIPYVLYYRTFEEWDPMEERKENNKYYHFLPTDSFPLNLTGITRKILANCHKPKELQKIYVNYDIEVEGHRLVVHSLWGW